MNTLKTIWLVLYLIGLYIIVPAFIFLHFGDFIASILGKNKAEIPFLMQYAALMTMLYLYSVFHLSSMIREHKALKTKPTLQD
ncbi:MULTISPECIES: hypothetical protein [Acinetobacter]|uniref:Uncharacterized protein n=1 Tax=Acinetobacter indicus TaxID=756892 RepID=A0A6C0Y6U5_9GAMM|nr:MULTISPECIES: hypothetical protein [Acinetobacter]QIC71856.1 hypothetical protein FSC09_15820 [Acinetobacter indicus]QKQ71392.1 hypothetical protein E5Y90_14270 [Acinetobacter sp. 10FS3-1]